MVKDLSDNPLSLHGLLFSISSKGSFIYRTAHTKASVHINQSHSNGWNEK